MKKKTTNEIILNQNLEKNIKKRFRKIDDPYYSLFDESKRVYDYMRRFSLILIACGLPIFILGLVLIIKVSILGIIPLTFGSLGVMVIFYSPYLIMEYLKFKPILEYKETKNIDKLVEMAKKYSVSNSFIAQQQASIATYLLVDFKSLEIAQILIDRLSQKKPKGVSDLLRVLSLLALKFGYDDHKQFLYDLIEGKQKEPEKKAIPDDVDYETVVPITKVYYLEEIPDEAKCMVSGLRIDFLTDDVVVCPYCSAWAKKELLDSWLIENDFCPVCRRELRIEDCPEVQISIKK